MPQKMVAREIIPTLGAAADPTDDLLPKSVIFKSLPSIACDMVAGRRKFLKYSSTIGIGSIAGCTGQLTGNSSEDEYPSQSIRNIIPYETGGGTDTYMRQVGQYFPDHLGVNAEYANVPGAAGLRGIGKCYNADPDGYTTVGVNPPAEILPVLIDPSAAENMDLGELEPVCSVGYSSFCLVANADAGIESFDDMVEKYKSGEFEKIGGTQAGGASHLSSLLLKNEAGLDWGEYVAYSGASPTVQAVSSGEVPVGVPTCGTAKAAVNEGLVEPIAVLRSGGSGVFPETKSITELGGPNIDFVGAVTRAILMPPETPQEKISTVEEGIKKIVNSDEMKNWSEETGQGIAFGNQEDTRNVWQGGLEKIPKKIDLEAIREKTS